MPSDSPEEILSLPLLLSRLDGECRDGKRLKTDLSHALAQGFRRLLNKEEGVKIHDEPDKSNANYFLVEVEGSIIGISPFGSYEGWWEKPSDGFLEIVRTSGYRWGVVLFKLPDGDGVWVDGEVFDKEILGERQKVHSDRVNEALRRGFAKSFRDPRSFVDLLRKPPRHPGSSFLSKKSK